MCRGRIVWEGDGCDGLGDIDRVRGVWARKGMFGEGVGLYR